VVGQQHQVARVDIGVHGARGVGQDQMLGPQRLQHLERQAHRVALAAFVVMRAAAEDGDAGALQIADDELGVVARHPRMGKARQVGVVDRNAVDLVGQMPEPEPRTRPIFGRSTPGAVADQGGEVLSVP
jgi:hypothetical protein